MLTLELTVHQFAQRKITIQEFLAHMSGLNLSKDDDRFILALIAGAKELLTSKEWEKLLNVKTLDQIIDLLEADPVIEKGGWWGGF